MENKTRLHFTSIFENIFGAIIFIVLILVSTLEDVVVKIISRLDVTKYGQINFLEIFVAIGFIIFVLALVFLFFYIKWKNTYVYFAKEMFVIEKGKLFKQKTTIKLQDISNINMKQNLFEKLVGTCSLKLDLNTMSNTNLTTKLIFKMTTAVKIKNYILNNEKPETVEKKMEEVLLSFSFKDVLKHCLLSINLFNLFLSIIFYGAIIINLFKIINIASIAIIMLLIIPIVWTVVRKMLGYLNFKLINNKDHLTLTYGFFTTVTYHIYLDKINAVIINQTFQARICHKYLIEVVNAGMGNDKQEKRILSLYIDKKTLDNLVDKLLPEYKLKPTVRQPKDALLTMFLNKIVIYLIIIGLSIFVSKYCLLLFILVFFTILLSYYTKGIAIKDNLQITSGLCFKKTVILGYDKIEQIKIVNGIFARLSHLNRVKVSIIGTALATQFTTGYFDYKLSEKIALKLVD